MLKIKTKLSTNNEAAALDLLSAGSNFNAKRNYFEVFVLMISQLKIRFDQKGLKALTRR